MTFLPQLPQHPKIQYAIILVIGRYSGWTAKHPECIDFQVEYITRGFNDPSSISAAALAMKYLCESCGPLMVRFLDDLHPFYNRVIVGMDRRVFQIVFNVVGQEGDD
jgi:transportin-3